MRDCLSDNEISAYVGGNLKNDTEIINHLNSCADCFDQVTTVMSLIDENKDVYDQLNQSYEEMVYKNKFFSFFDSLSKYIADFISDVLMPRKYYALGTAVVVALVVFNTTSFEKTEINEYSAINLAEKYGSAVKNAKINPIWQKEFASISKELDSEPAKRHAFEIGKNLMQIEAVIASGKKDEVRNYFNKISDNPLIKKKDSDKKVEDGTFDIAGRKRQVDLYLKEMDSTLVDYVKYGVFVEAAKYEAAKSEIGDYDLRNSVKELGISAKDMKKYNNIFEKIRESE